MPSFYYPLLAPGQTKIRLEGSEYHHLIRVRRAGLGDSIFLNGGQGFFAEARVEELDKKGAWLKILELKTHEPFSPRLGIAFALLKGGHDELIIEKCTELGVVDFFPFKSRYCVRSEGKNTIERFEKTALSAIKQCDNPFLPTVHSVSDISVLLKAITSEGYRPLLCSEIEQERRLRELDLGQDSCFIVGPEGGFSEAEFELFADIEHLSISPLITRAETAAIAASAQFSGLRF